MTYSPYKVFTVLALLISNVSYVQDPSGIDQMLGGLVKFILILFVIGIVVTILIVFYFTNRKNRKTVRENQEQQEFPGPKLIEILPNSTLILVLGILSILTSCFVIIGLPLGIVSLILASKAKKQNTENPEGYTGYQNVRIGKVLAIFGILFNGFYVVKIMIPIIL
jgi:heme/copper-type cytochrome/quinol oxidase subunit 2